MAECAGSRSARAEARHDLGVAAGRNVGGDDLADEVRQG